jgi:hypothetical protein
MELGITSFNATRLLQFVYTYFARYINAATGHTSVAGRMRPEGS